MAARFLLAKKKAEELIKKACIVGAPVPLGKIAQLVNAKVQYEPFTGGLSGLMHRNLDGTATIGINVAHAPVRRRFTLAHEIGHVVLHSDEQLHVDQAFPIAFRDEDSGLGTHEIEIEANQFAASLLMPEAFLRQDVFSTEADHDFELVISALAKKYKVSVQAMSIRLNTLGLLA